MATSLEIVPVEEIFIQPVAGDNGGAMGAALWLWHQVLNKQRDWKLTSPYLGPEYSEQQMQQALTNTVQSTIEWTQKNCWIPQQIC